MESKTVIAILSIIVILLAIGLVVELFAFNNNSQPSNILNNTTSQNTTVESISSDSKQDSSSEDPIEANRPKNDSRYKGYTPNHESEITSDGWNPREHETYRERMPDGTQKIHYDDGYFRLVDDKGYVITYGYG